MFGLAVSGVLLAYLLHRRTAVAPDAVASLPFLSGWRPAEHALSRFEARYYPMTLLFLAFDVEMLYMYPWATVVASIGTSAIVEMFVLLGVLMTGVLWAWREGALRWT
nr:NADH-quinone oxidoreductase subunit A [Modestobacter marinus]